MKLHFTEDSIQVLGVDSQSRFSDNIANMKPLLEIPVKHMAFRCREDKYGDCTNQEEENSEITWNQKDLFKPDFDRLSVIEATALPISLDNFFGSTCYREKNSDLLSYTIDDKSVNFKIKKTYSISLDCNDSFSPIDTREKVFDSSIASVVFNYSFVKKSELDTKGYKPIAYPISDENTFGFFTTTKDHLDVDNKTYFLRDQVYLNRWAPDRKTIEYKLTQNFDKPENKGLKEATIKGFDKVNQALRQAGVDLNVTWSMAEDGYDVSDVRSTAVILVEDPYSRGTAGYGPSVVMPDTGEIVSARTVMFSGVMKKYIEITYNEVYEQSLPKVGTLDLLNLAPLMASQKDLSEILLKDVKEGNQLNVQLMNMIAARQENQQAAAKAASEAMKEALEKEAALSPAPVSQNLSKVDFSPAELALMKEAVESPQLNKELVDTKSMGAFITKHCVYDSEEIDFAGPITAVIKKKFGEKLKPWSELTTEERQSVIDLVLPEVWLSTFVHEIGHNLGLRHNFAGSRDAANFYSKAELKKMGSDLDHIPFASVMDYGYSDLNDLPSMGKYDVAALKFAYNREVVDQNGNVVKIPDGKSLEDLAASPEVAPLKQYAYCTDEHVAVNSNCNRFDEGTTIVEITNHFINNFYKKGYERRNKRSGRENFSLLDDARYLGSINFTFSMMRLNFQSYESVKNRFNIPDDHPLWEQEGGFLKDLRDAVNISADFLVEVINTPDKLCAIARREDPTAIVELVPLKTLVPFINYESCFDINVESELGSRFAQENVIVAETGKSLHSFKAHTNPLPNADQIDVRGAIYDKVMALETLTKRTTGISIFDRWFDSFLDIPAVREKINQSLKGLVNGTMVGDLEFTLRGGQKQVIRTRYPMGSKLMIEKSFDPRVNERLGIYHDVDTPLVGRLLTMTKEHTPVKGVVNTSLKAFELDYDVTKMSLLDPVGVDAMTLTFGDSKYVALPGNLLASKIIEEFSFMNYFQTSQLDVQKIVLILNQRIAGALKPAPEEIEEGYEPFWDVDILTFLKLSNGMLMNQDQSIQALDYLAM